MPFDKSALKDYVDVAERIRAWYEAYPNARIETRIIEHNDKRVVVEARAYRGVKFDGASDELGFMDDRPAGVGHSAMQIPGATPYTRGSEIENCETSAVGRALVMAGLPSKRIASDDEIRSKAAPTKAEPVQERAKPKTDDEIILNAATAAFDGPTPAAVEWADSINTAASVTELAKIGQQIATAKLSLEDKNYLQSVYKSRKAAL
jgi:hypothetical protein